MADKTKSKNRKRQPVKKEQQNRREIIALACFGFAIFALLCCLNTDAFLLKPCAAFVGGLFGQLGRYLLPVILGYTGVILITSRGKSVTLRVTATLAIVLTVSAVLHLILELIGDESAGLSIAKLYTGGKGWVTGGLFPGFVANLLSLAITKVGALIAFLILLVLEIIYCLGMSVNGIINAVKKVPREEKEEPKETKEERLVNRFVEKRQERKVRKTTASDIDIPVDEPPALKPRRERENRPISPDEYISRGRKEKDLPIVDAEKKQITIDEIELQDPVEEKIPVAVQEDDDLLDDRPIYVPEVMPIPEKARVDAVSGMPELELEPPQTKMKRGEAEEQACAISEEIARKADPIPAEYVFPSISLLSMQRGGSIDATAEMRENSKRLADTLESFGIEPHIVNVIRGPSVTRYELELDRGVKLSRITNLADDIALSLGATGVRISAIPDRISVVGIEVPNKSVNTVYAREVIGSPAFKDSGSPISFAVGKDISGNCIVGDIAKLPHMLIAGTTGSGKSVCMNTLIVSLLYKAKPDEVRLIMVDPKMVELGVYNGIPHLLIPVVTDPKKAAGALQWTVTEMMRRYRLMSEIGTRDLASYNKAIADDPNEQKLPQVVVVIDELADLMLVAAKEVEESICRIAQMGRASGIHLVIATQRPSADVITGLMKANIPSRIAFAVSSAMESRIILDNPGAEKLVGKGDMLFAPLGQGKPKRVQGCFINDDEVQAVVNAIKAQTTSDYSEDIMEQIERRAEQSGKHSSAADSTAGASDNQGDELLPAAVEVILETGQASVSMLQRRLKLGYARAARIVDEMEERGIVGPFEGAKPRQLLITKEQWQQMQNGTFEANPPVEEEIP